nr:MAG TPA: hypothetical protein [Caudoviricetes sp.]
MSVSASQSRARRTVATPTPQSSASLTWHPRRSFMGFRFAIWIYFVIFAY